MTEFAIDVATFAERVSDPGATANTGKFYSKDVSGVTHEFFQASDGTVFQLSPVVPGAGAVEYSSLTQSLVLVTSTALPNSAVMTNVFDAANDTFTLAANTKYLMRGILLIDRSVGVAAASTMMEFAGTAAPACVYTAWVYYGGLLPVSTTPAVAFVTTTASSALTAATTGGQKRVVEIDGIVTTTAAGTFIPKTGHDNAPGGTSTILVGSYLELIPLGADTFTQQGGWTA